MSSCPIQALPTEILRIIFSYCLSKPPHDRFYPRISWSEAPLLLTVVCHRWKEIAETSSDLWTSIHIHLPNPSPPYRSLFSWKWHYNLLRKWLSYTAGRPLIMSLLEDGWWDAKGEYLGSVVPFHRNCRPTVIDYLKVLMRYSQQWLEVSVMFKFTDRRNLTAFDHLLSYESLPLLRSFNFGEEQLDDNAHLGDGGWQHPLEFLRKARHLSCITFHNILHRSMVPEMLHLELSHLQSIKMSTTGAWVPRFPYIYTFLKLCTSLVEIELNLRDRGSLDFYDDERDDDPFPTEPFVLPNLLKAAIWVDQEDVGGCGTMDIISVLTFPKLASLSILLPNSQTLHALLNCLGRSQPPLKSLHMSFSVLSDSLENTSGNPVIPCLRLCRFLKF